MKRNRTVWAVVAIMAIAAGLYFTGCEQPTSEPDETPPVVIVDKPAEGVMTKGTADKVFTWKAEGAGAVIEKFLDAGALQGYLAGSRQVTGNAGATLVIKEIDGRAVTRIAGNAFKPAAAGGNDDITTVVAVVKLPETIESLGAKLFEGVSKPVQVDIPNTAPVIAKIVEEKVAAAKAALGAEATEVEIAAAVEAAVAAAKVEVTAVLEVAAGAEAGIGITVSADPSVPPDPAVPVLPPEVIVTKPETVPEPGTDEPGTDEPGTSSTPEPSEPTPPAPTVSYYRVRYDGNGATGGTAPVDGNAPYLSGASVTALANTFVKSGWGFIGWNTVATGGAETRYEEGDTFAISGHTTLYAEWLPTVTINTISGITGPNATATPVSTITESVQYTGTVTWTAWNPGTGAFDAIDEDFSLFAAGKLYKATITLSVADGYTFIGVPENFFTVAGATATNPANTGEITAVFAGIRADSPIAENLAIAIAAAKRYNTAKTPAGQATIYLSEAFYTSATTNVIVVDPDSVDNDTPYTIKGLGGKGSTTAPVLNVGILLANDNVTLDGVKIFVNNIDKAAPAGGDYKAAVSITRANTGGILTGAAQASNDVTVQNCDITFSVSASNMTAGIFVSGDHGAPYTPSADIAIINNNVTATNSTNYANQAIVFRRTGGSFTLTDNVLVSSNATGGDTVDAPASALLLSIQQDEFTLPEISGNTLKGGEFDFYINLFSKGEVGKGALFVDKFGTLESKWASKKANDTNSPYKQLLNKLVKDAKGPAGDGNGFGRFLEYIGTPAGHGGSGEFALEYYEIAGGRITAVNFWSGGLAEGGALYNADGPTSETLNVPVQGGGSTLNNKGVRGRLTIDTDGNTTLLGDFHWTRTNANGPNVNLPEEEPEEPEEE
ncbi:MAG: InlB B-repeat-containing protein [Treponema sp.]|nr:InlB B-repeat-containing protein [Treponema sp.]